MPTGRPPFHENTRFACDKCLNYECTPNSKHCIHWPWCDTHEYRIYKVSLKTKINNLINKLFRFIY